MIKSKTLVTIIILNWNGEKLLKENISSVLKQDYKNYKILLVDNGSTDGSIDYVQQLMKKIKKIELLETGKNYGFAEGNNMGIRKVLKENNSKYIVLLNNDMRVEKNWLSNLISGFNSPNIGICTSKILLYYPFQQIVLVPSKNSTFTELSIDNLEYHICIFENGFDQSGKLVTMPFKFKSGKIYNFAIPYLPSSTTKTSNLNIKFTNGQLKLFSGEEKIELAKSGSYKINLDGKHIIQHTGSMFLKKLDFKERHFLEFDQSLESKIVDGGCGGAMAIRADLLKKLGIFNKNYFMYYEDSELSFRYQRTGFLTKFVSNAICYHYFWGSSYGKVSTIQIYHGARNRLLFIKQYFGNLSFLYHYIRTVVRTVIWGFKTMLLQQEAKIYFFSYLQVLKSTIIK